MTRIVAGTHGGHTLSVPSQGTRPTSERVREALFSKLDHMGMCDDTQVLDLFAGSGALALEALSRGAAHAILVEKSAPASRVIARNIDALRLRERATVVTGDAVNYLKGKDAEPLSGNIDLVLIDPPYDLPPQIVETVLGALAPWITPDALIVLEASSRQPLPAIPDFLVLEESKKYGETTVYFLGPPPAESPALSDIEAQDEEQ